MAEPNGSAHEPSASTFTNHTTADGVKEECDATGSSYHKDYPTCETCRQLDLTVDKFVIEGGKELSREAGRPAGIRQSHNFKQKSKNVRTSLGYYKEILERHQNKSCRLCSLVIASTDNFRAEDEERNPKCYATWEIDGRRTTSDGDVRRSTRRIHLSWDDNTFEDSYLVFKAPERYYRFNSDKQDLWEERAQYLGRDVRPHRKNEVLIKSWLDICLGKHNADCRATEHPASDSKAFKKLVEQSYFGVIDVLDMCLKPLPKRARIGGKGDAIVVRDKLDYADRDGGYPEYLVVEKRREREHKRLEIEERDYKRVEPQQFVLFRQTDDRNESSGHSDAHDSDDDDYELEPYVALSYVWGKKTHTTKLENVMVHREQGGLENHFDELPRVIQDAIHLVRRLGFRYLWIDALCIVQNDHRSWRLNSRKMDLIYGNAILTICAADGDGSEAGLRALHNAPVQHEAECAPQVTLIVSHLIETGIRRSKWNTRAWTFQERLLSRRCLIFALGRVFFQCRRTTMSEDIVAGSKGVGWSLDLIQAPTQMLRELERRPFFSFMNCVPLYSSRDLTKAGDIITAFNGVSNLLAKSLGGPLLFGLPTSHFDLALLWEPTGKTKLRNLGSQRIRKDAEERELEFPSWSWCGWMGAQIEYRPQTLEGCLLDAHEFLMKHTWIRWYVRDGWGKLRPLWDRAKAMPTAAEEVESRWRGYAADRGRETRRRAPVKYEASDESSSSSSSPRRSVRIYLGPDEPTTDEYGRCPPPDQQDSGTSNHGSSTFGYPSKFRQTIPQSPYRVLMTCYTHKPDSQFPDQPLLQFWTWSTFLRLVSRDEVDQSLGLGLTRLDIHDEVGDWCGSIVLNKDWVQERKDRLSHDFDGSRYEFIAISHAKAFTDKECTVWTYYVPSERDQSEWELYYVLLVERGNHGTLRRVALGKVFQMAFHHAGFKTKWKEIILG